MSPFLLAVYYLSRFPMYFVTAATATVASKVTTVVHGEIAGVDVPYPTAYSDACATTGIKCPLKPNDRNLYKAKLEVKPEYPSVGYRYSAGIRLFNCNFG